MRYPVRDTALIVAGVILAFTQLGYSAEVGAPWLVPEPGATESFSAETEFLPSIKATLPVAFAAPYLVDKPAWHFHVEALALQRSNTSDRPFAALTRRVWIETENPTREEGEPEYVWTHTDSSTTVLSTQDLHFPFELGLRIQAGRTLGDRHSFEICYFGLAEWNESAAVGDNTVFVASVDEDGRPAITFPASLASPFSDFGDWSSNHPLGIWGIQGFDFNWRTIINYSSSLYNIECNLRRWISEASGADQVSILIGARYMNVDETFYYEAISEVPAPVGAFNSLYTDTANRMMGVQIGAAYEIFLLPVWYVECEVKGAIFNNSASQNTLFEHIGEDILLGVYAGHSERDITASAIDVRLTNTLLVTPRLAIRLGYQFLYVDGVALASESFNQHVELLVSGPVSLNEGQVAYHGLQLGVSWVW